MVEMLGVPGYQVQVVLDRGCSKDAVLCHEGWSKASNRKSPELAAAAAGAKAEFREEAKDIQG